MNVISRTWDTWRRSSRVAAQQLELVKCPCCYAGEPEFLFDGNDLWTYVFVDGRLKRGRYSLCHGCGTIFAALRPRPEAAGEYYELFPELEGKTHNIYPPPTQNSKGKIARANAILQILEQRGLLKPDCSILHLRCEIGAVLKLLRNRLPSATLHGLDYFVTNVRYLREEGFDVSRLNAAAIEVPLGGSYDLILANHIFTHALNPRNDLRALRSALKPGGKILLYGEVDHATLFDPASPLFSRIDTINYHKQLFVPETLEALLHNAGFTFQFLGRHRFTLTYLATPSDAQVRAPQVAPEFLECQRQMVKEWQKIVKRYRYPIAMVELVKPILRWNRARKRREKLPN